MTSLMLSWSKTLDEEVQDQLVTCMQGQKPNSVKTVIGTKAEDFYNIIPYAEYNTVRR